MTDTLGVHIGDGFVTAARYDATRGDTVHMVELGDGQPAAPAMVARDAGGAVVFGEAAVAGDGPRVTDPLARAIAGRRGALVALLGHVIGRATTAAGTAPGRLALVVADDLDAAARDQLVAAGVAAGVADTVVVPESVAAAQPLAVDPAVHLAAGGARAAALASAPLVTREDLGEEVAPRATTASGPPPPVDGPVSVFDDGPEPARVVPVPAAPAAPASTSAADARPASASAGPPPVEPLRYEPPQRRIPATAWAVAVLLGLIGAVVGGIFLVRGGSGDGSAGEVGGPTSVAPAAPSPTITPTTPTASSSTSTTTTPTASSSTSSSTSSTTSSSTTSTTTSRPVAIAEPGQVTLVETGLQFADGGVVRFEQDAEVVLDEVRAVLGDPDDDTGYEVNEFCAGARSRFVRWGDLELVLTEDDLDSGVGVFSQWYASGSDHPEGLVTRDRLGVGSTVAFLEVTYGSALAIVEAIEGEPLGLFAVTNPASGGILNGLTTSLEPDATVTDLWAGDSCPRVFT